MGNCANYCMTDAEEFKHRSIADPNQATDSALAIKGNEVQIGDSSKQNMVKGMI